MEVEEVEEEKEAGKDDRGRSPSGCATMSGSFLTGPPRKADQGGKGGFDPHQRINCHGRCVAGR
jgi:hypothetical protein